MLASPDRLKRIILARLSVARKAAILAIAMALAAVIRIAIDRGTFGYLFLTFLPVVLLASIFLGGEFGAIAAIASIVLVRLLFSPPTLFNADHPGPFIIILGIYICVSALVVATGHMLRRMIIENEAHARQQQMFNDELQHRTKNVLQMVRALVARGPRGEDPASYFTSLSGRLDALSNANELLRFGVLPAAPLRDLVLAATRPFDHARIRTSGPDCEIDSSAGTPLMMALHELCTNATKYGALSIDGGQVQIDWQRDPAATDVPIRLTWRESGGPAVTPPSHCGLGTRLLVANGGLTNVNLDWHPQGLVCTMEVRPGLPAGMGSSRS